MNESKETCAPENVVLTYTERWQRIDRRKAEDYVRKLQARIVKAQREGKYGKVKSLQWLLTHSFYGRYLAVVRVTANKGKNTAGVDRVKWSSDAAKAKAIASAPCGDSEEEWKKTPVGYPNNERPCYAGVVSYGS